MLRDYCLTSKESSDLFVGIRFKDGVPEVIFPHGYCLPEEDNECRKDIFLLLAVLQRFSSHREGESDKQKDGIESIPIMSYQYVIQDYLLHGYYTENEVKYVQAERGKINWKRTIQQEQAQIDNGNVVYLNFQIKVNQICSNSMLTQIHKYCVYYSFMRFGWLFLSTDYTPQKPEIPFNSSLFVSILKQARNGTYNDQKRKLFQSMINIIQDNKEEFNYESVSLGVNRFDPIWERLIDHVFGEESKEEYLPHATWHVIKNGRIEKSSALEPDTIMVNQGKVYVLDAKYYQYGITGHINDLPTTSSIQKQITYGKHVANLGKSAENQVYNAFIMPGALPDELRPYKFVSVATADWEKYDKKTPNYAFVLGIVLDTKWLIQNYAKHKLSEIYRLSELIEESLLKFRTFENG